MIIVTSNKFNKQFEKQPKKIRDQFKLRMEIFTKDINDRTLNIHKLSGKYDNLWSLNVSGDIRVIFDRNHKDIIVLVAIGSHSELYE